MKYTLIILMLLGHAIAYDREGLVFGGGLGLHLFAGEEKDDFGSTNYEGSDGGVGAIYSVVLGGGTDLFSVYGLLEGATFFGSQAVNNYSNSSPESISKDIYSVGIGGNYYFDGSFDSEPYIILRYTRDHYIADGTFKGAGKNVSGGIGFNTDSDNGFELILHSADVTERDRSYSYLGLKFSYLLLI